MEVKDVAADQYNPPDYILRTNGHCGDINADHRQLSIDAAYINELLERDEQILRNVKPPGDSDLFVDMGDLTNSLPSRFDTSEYFERQVMDYVDTFNHAIIQGVPPVHALQTFTKALSVALVACVSANMHPGIGLTFLKAAELAVHGARSRVRVITSNN